MSDILNGVKTATAEVLNIDAATIGDNADFINDLGGDSVQAAEWVAAVECEFDLDIDPDSAMRLRTIGDMAKLIEKLG